MSDDAQFKYPKAVQDQIERNLAALKPPGEATDGTSPTHESEPDREPEAKTEPRKDVQQASPPEREPKPEQPKAEPEQEHDWEKRYKNYKKSTDSTLYELRTALAQKDEQMQKMQQDVQAMQEYMRRQPAPQQQHPDMPDDLKKKLKELYGDEDLDAMQSLAKHVASRELAARDRVILDLRKQVEYLLHDTQARQQTLQQQAQSEVLKTVEERLEEAVPGWRKIDSSPEFIEWLKQPDPNSLSGKSRQEMMAAAYKNGSLADLSRHYREYSNERGLNDGPKQDPRLSTTLPRSNPAAEPTAQKQTNVLRPGLYQQMVRDKNLRRISEDEFRAFEKQYFQALRGGRAA